MSLYFGYKKDTVDTEDLEKSISALKTGLATNNTKTQSLESSLFKKDGSTQMTGNLDLGDNSIVGVHDINADNSVSSKKYIKDELAKRLPLDGSLNMTGTLALADGLVMISGMMNMADQRIRFLPTPSVNSDAATKKYVDDKSTTNSTNITSLAGRVTILESKKDIYTYNFSFINLGPSFVYPVASNAGYSPYHWMYCKNMTSSSRFHVHTLVYDSDAGLSNSNVLTFRLDFIEKDGTHIPKDIFTATVRDHIIPGERMLFIDKKFNPSTLTGYQNFVMARLAVKVNATKGNEFTMSCSFNI